MIRIVNPRCSASSLALAVVPMLTSATAHVQIVMTGSRSSRGDAEPVISTSGEEAEAAISAAKWVGVNVCSTRADDDRAEHGGEGESRGTNLREKLTHNASPISRPKSFPCARVSCHLLDARVGEGVRSQPGTGWLVRSCRDYVH